MGRIIDWIGKNETAANMGASAVGGAIGMIGEGARYRRNMKGQKNLMDIQQQNQMALNQQGHKLQMDMWKKTNYPAQIAMLKEAGLNPALMYGSAGQGGTTGSQGGGSAAGGAVPGVNMNDMLIGAQIANLNADTSKKENEGRLEGLKADQQAILNNYVDENEKNNAAIILERYNKAVEEGNQAEIETQLKNALLNMKKAGVLNNGDTINWFTVALGLDPTKEDFLDKRFSLIDGVTQAKLVSMGIPYTPSMSYRELLVASEMAIATGKATIDAVKWLVETGIKVREVEAKEK